MLLEYQIRNLKHLELALQTTDTITIIGQPKSGRKTVISSLNFEKSLFISIVPYTNQYQNCSDFLTAIKNIKVLTLNSYEISPEFSIGDILSIGIERKELFELENHLIKNIKRASRKYKIVLVVENFNDLDNGTKALINKIRSSKIKNRLKKGLVCIFIPDKHDINNIIGKDIYFDKLNFNEQNSRSIFTALNLNSDINLTNEVMCFILKNANGNIELISSIINDINHKRIDEDLDLLDINNNIEKLVNNKINLEEFSDKLKYILNVIAISNKYFSDLDLSFLLSEEVNIIDYYMNFADENKYVNQSNNCYQIIFGIIKKIFSTIPKEQKIKIYNDIVKLINAYYPNQYQEKYAFAKLANNRKANTYLLQAIFQQIRNEGNVRKEEFSLSEDEYVIVDNYFKAYSKANNNNYEDSIQAINDIIEVHILTSPIKEEFLLLKSQSLIKSIDGRDRKEAIEILNYDEKNYNIDEYLRYRIETRKIAALIHNGNYKQAQIQSTKMENKFLNIINENHSPGIEYYLNVIYRKYSNIHSYESSIVAINKSIEYFSKNPNYIKETYISLNNALALNLINGNQIDALRNIEKIKKLREEHFNYRFPREEVYENNGLIYQLIYGDREYDICTSFEKLYEKTMGMADNIFICSNYAISLALFDQIEKSISLLEDKYNDPSVKNDKEGVYKYRVFCNYAILDFMQNKDKERALKILSDVYISKEDVHYSERSTELNTIIKTIKNFDKCSSASEWMNAYKSNVESIKNYFCLHQQGFLFTTLFDWDDE